MPRAARSSKFRLASSTRARAPSRALDVRPRRRQGIARQLETSQQDLQADEDLIVERLPLQEALSLALSGGIDDGKSICALLRAAGFLGLLPSSGGLSD
jgi:hypothetical protein